MSINIFLVTRWHLKFGKYYSKYHSEMAKNILIIKESLVSHICAFCKKKTLKSLLNNVDFIIEWHEQLAGKQIVMRWDQHKEGTNILDSLLKWSYTARLPEVTEGEEPEPPESPAVKIPNQAHVEPPKETNWICRW